MDKRLIATIGFRCTLLETQINDNARILIGIDDSLIPL